MGQDETDVNERHYTDDGQPIEVNDDDRVRLEDLAEAVAQTRLEWHCLEGKSASDLVRCVVQTLAHRRTQTDRDGGRCSANLPGTPWRAETYWIRTIFAGQSLSYTNKDFLN